MPTVRDACGRSPGGGRRLREVSPGEPARRCFPTRLLRRRTRTEGMWRCPAFRPAVGLPVALGALSLPLCGPGALSSQGPASLGPGPRRCCPASESDILSSPASQVMRRSHEAREKLLRLGIFKQVDVLIDTCQGTCCVSGSVVPPPPPGSRRWCACPGRGARPRWSAVPGGGWGTGSVCQAREGGHTVNTLSSEPWVVPGAGAR